MQTGHGTVQTPAFMPVGTQGAVKAVTHRDLQEVGVEIILANTYHLFLRPGDERIARLGGLHRFIGWDKPILTDSGGYQVFSLATRRTIGHERSGAGRRGPASPVPRAAAARGARGARFVSGVQGSPRVNEEGVRFRSHLDGTEHLLTPEGAAEIQARLGSDIAMVLDECLAYPASPDEARESVALTLRWGRRARERFLQLKDQGLQQVQFGIIQGGTFPDLRQMSVEGALGTEFDAYAIGGLSVGEPVSAMYDVTESTARLLPVDRPRYLMGTGTPLDLVESVARGMDLFDCVLPTRNARNGQLFTRLGRLNIKNAEFADDERPVDEACGCYTCRQFTRAYLRHLFHAGEMASATLNTLHNLRFYLDTMQRIREAIVFGTLEEVRQEYRRIFPLHYPAASGCDDSG